MPTFKDLICATSDSFFLYAGEVSSVALPALLGALGVPGLLVRSNRGSGIISSGPIVWHGEGVRMSRF